MLLKGALAARVERAGAGTGATAGVVDLDLTAALAELAELEARAWEAMAEPGGAAEAVLETLELEAAVAVALAAMAGLAAREGTANDFLDFFTGAHLGSRGGPGGRSSHFDLHGASY